MKKDTISKTLIAFAFLVIISCGGSSSSSAPNTVSGTASGGAALTGTVYLKDSKGVEKSAVIGSGGSFSIIVDGLMAPFLLKAVSADNVTTLYSFTISNGVLNINPFTNVAVSGAAGTADLDTLYSSSYVNQSASMSAGWNTSVSTLKNELGPIFANFNVTDTDFVSGTIQLGRGVDSIFDNVTVKINTATNTITMYGSDPTNPFITVTLTGGNPVFASNWVNMPNTSNAAFNMSLTISDQAQLTTLAFSGLALITGNLQAQSFFPPGKVADYTGFQYLRDNDPDNMGHNTSFLTRVANNVIYILNDAQFSQLKALAALQGDEVNLYGYKRYPLMMAFRRLIAGDIPAGSAGLNLNAVKKASEELYLIDGHISFERAQLYASIINSFDAHQIAYLSAMKGQGFNSWPSITDAQIQSRMQTLPAGSAVAIMTYASDIYSWYNGSLAADVYFCPERHGTYYGGFYIKDAPAVGHDDYSISEQLTATAGSALSDTAQGYVTQAQASLIAGLVDTQRNNLYASATSNIVQVRTQIATLLRSLMTSTVSSNDVKNQVLSLSQTYGQLDGENNYYYATVFAQVYSSLTDAQKTSLANLRKSILSGTYSDGTAFDFTTAANYYLYSDIIADTSALSPYIGNTDYLFFEP